MTSFSLSMNSFIFRDSQSLEKRIFFPKTPNQCDTKPIPQNTQTAKVPKSKKASLKDSPFSKFRVILPTLMKIFTAKYQKKCQ